MKFRFHSSVLQSCTITCAVIDYRRLLLNRQNSSRLLCHSFEFLRCFAQHPFWSISFKSNFVQYLSKNLFAWILLYILVHVKNLNTLLAVISTRHFLHQQLITSKDRSKLNANRVDRESTNFNWGSQKCIFLIVLFSCRRLGAIMWLRIVFSSVILKQINNLHTSRDTSMSLITRLVKFKVL